MDTFQVLLLAGISQEAEVTDFHKPCGKDVEEESSDKLRGIKGQEFDLIMIVSIFVAEGHCILL